RPYIWNNFSSTLRYTYIKHLQHLKYHKNVDRILKKENINFSFRKNIDWDLVWDLHISDLIKFNVGISKAKQFLFFFKEMNYLGILETYNAYYQNVFVSSILVIIDKDNKRAYFPFIGTMNGHYEDGMSAKLYDFTLVNLKNQGILSVDF